jgi:hypothetical protein
MDTPSLKMHSSGWIPCLAFKLWWNAPARELAISTTAELEVELWFASHSTGLLPHSVRLDNVQAQLAPS